MPRTIDISDNMVFWKDRNGERIEIPGSAHQRVPEPEAKKRKGKKGKKGK